MHHHTIKTMAIFLLVFLFIAVAASAQAQIIEAAGKGMSGALLVKSLRDAANGIVDNSGDELRATATSAVADLHSLADHLEKILGDNINKPIGELTGTMKTAVEKGWVGFQLGRNFLASTRSCLNQNMAGLLASIEGTLTHNINDSVPWSDSNPIVTNVYRIGTQASFGLRSGVNQTLIMEGANFSYATECGATAEIVTVDAGPEVPSVELIGIDPRRISLLIGEIEKDGTYDIVVSLGQKKKFWFGCSENKVARATISVLPEPKFIVSYSIVPSCKINPTIRFNAGYVKKTNSKCDGDKIANGTFTLKDPWKYVSYEWDVTSINGDVDCSHKYLGGNQVFVECVVPERGGWIPPFGPCAGKRKWINGTVYINGIKDEVSIGEVIRGVFPSELTFDQTMSITPVTPKNQNCSNLSGWTVSVSVIFPDGTRHDIPPVSGQGTLSAAADGVVFFWEPTSYTLSVSTPPNNCGGL